MRPVKPCRQPHGTIARYTAGCSCFECRVVWTEYQVARSRTPQKVDKAEAMRHVARLKAQGMDYQDIAFAAGMAMSTLTHVRKHSRMIRSETADAILGVMGPREKRRLDAEYAAELLREGRSPRQIAEALGCSERHIYRLRAAS